MPITVNLLSSRPNRMQHHLETIARESGISLSSVAATSKLIAEGGTVPFISRYRKEQTGSLDEVHEPQRNAEHVPDAEPEKHACE